MAPVSSFRTTCRALALATAAALAAGCAAMPPRPAERPAAAIERQQVEAFADLFYRQKKVRQAFEAHVAEAYIQHAANLPHGREATITGLEKFVALPNLRLEPVRVIVEGDMVVIVVKAQLPNGSTSMVVDLFRAENGRLVEHWDLKQPVPPELVTSVFARLATSP